MQGQTSPCQSVRLPPSYWVAAGLASSPGIFQEKMTNLFSGLEYVRCYIDDILCITKGNWDDHLTTAFPEVRLKRFLEMRGADGGPWRRICALPALWVGLLYHQASLDAASDLVSEWSLDDKAALMRDVTRDGLGAKVKGQPVLEIAKQVLELSRQGLAARQSLNNQGQDETIFLSALNDITECGMSPAAHKLKLYEDKWDQNIDPIFKEYAY